MAANKNNSKLTWFIVGFFFALFLGIISCEVTDGFGIIDNNDKVEVDTVYVDRVIEVPGQSGEFDTEEPEPKIVYQADPKLVLEYKKLQDENQRLEAFIKAVTKRVYENTYVSNDSIVTIKVKDSVTGFLDWQNVVFDIKPREVTIQEKIVTQTVEKYPDFSIMAGVGTRASLSVSKPVIFEAVFGIEDKKGYTYHLTYDTEQYMGFRVTKKLFTKF